MMGQISIKTKVGWISAFAYKNKIHRVKFGKLKKKLLEFEKNAKF